MRHYAIQLLAAMALSVQLLSGAQAATVDACDDHRSSVQSLAEPWEANTRTFLRGAVRIAVIDTGGEPACCSVHLLVLATKPEDSSGPAELVCRVISQKDQLGFMSIDFASIRYSYTPANGLNLLVPFRTYVDGVKSTPGALRVRVDPRTGVITAR
jgi:hypothetical protein